MSDEFYVGYLEKAPSGVARWLRARVILILLLGVTVAGALVASQNAFPAKVFEWGNTRSFVGVLEESPVPSLLVRRPGRASTDESYSRILLVGVGKRGAGFDVHGFDGQLVELTGTLIYRDGTTMVEVVPGSVTSLNGDESTFVALETKSLGTQTFVGEIVDSKCYLGVMAPGATKPHRACATRCISGGIPPVLMVRQEAGPPTLLLLVSSTGRSVNQEVLPLVAEVVEITGELEKHADLWVLKADPSTYRRVSS